MGKLDLTKVAAALEKANRRSGGNNDYDKLVQGKNVRRILWPKGDHDLFFSDGYLHFGLGDDGHGVATCPKTFDTNAKCPICERVDELRKSRDKDDKKLADRMRATRRVYVNAINRDEDDDSPRILPIGVTVLKALLQVICDPDYGDITNPTTGRDVTITRTGQGMDTKYSVLPKPKSTPVSDTLDPDEIEDRMADLDSLFIESSYDELEARMNGEDISADDDDEDDGTDEYDEMTLNELMDECEDRGLRVPKKPNRLKLVTMLIEDDESDDAEEEDEEGDDDDDSDDEVKSAIMTAMNNRSRRRRHAHYIQSSSRLV